ncbi:MAG: exodeoxyribonuclease V subunit alpha [Leptospiraceae bacterium]|jgi:exodeoxyribonuclease V alpha subunit|nr:exodeoxyribonuclease V subunit alpha [Leptospiraceae bacterium]
MQSIVKNFIQEPNAYYLFLIEDIYDYLALSLREEDQHLFEILVYYLLWSIEKGNLCIDLDDPMYLNLFKQECLNLNSIELNQLKIIINKIKDFPNYNKIFELYQERFLFFKKHYDAQILLKQKIESLKNHQHDKTELLDTQKILSYFESIPTRLNLMQKLGVLLSLPQRFLIISGGPGTGKTTIASHIIGLHLFLGMSPYRIAISAPTGRAASRLYESLKSQLDTKDIELIEPKTLHRLLNFRPFKNEFYYGENNHLPFDLILVDESSMIDVFLLKQLFSAISFEKTKLILLGDHNQLPSVQEGNTLSDLIPTSNIQPSKKTQEFLLSFFPNEPIEINKINPYFVELKESYRSKKIIKLLADSIIKNEDYKMYLNYNDEVQWIEEENPKQIEKILLDFVNDHIIKKIRDDLKVIQQIPKEEWSQDISDNNPIHRIYETIVNYKILTPYNSGNFGVQTINEMILNHFFKKKVSSGIPIIIKENDYHNNLYNGDIGVILQDKNNNFYACFKSSNQYIFYSFLSLSLFDYSFAITIHKSQGSEYKKVLLILPERKEQESSELINRQILYTGITRTKETLILVSSYNTLEKAVKNKIIRISGIKIW